MLRPGFSGAGTLGAASVAVGSVQRVLAGGMPFGGYLICTLRPIDART